MAAELTLQGLNIVFTKANCPSINITIAAIQPTVTGTQYMDNVQSIGFAAEEAILLGDVASGGYCFFQNMDATNFVSLRQGTGTTNFVKLLAGEWACFRLSADSTAPFAIADTAAVNLRCLRFDL